MTPNPNPGFDPRFNPRFNPGVNPGVNPGFGFNPGLQRNGTFIGAIRGPVIMITLGTLVLVDYSGGLSFWRTWPVLLIVGGVLKLAERMGATKV